MKFGVLGAPFGSPFYDGSPFSSSSDVPGVWPVAIDGHGYVIEAKEFEQMTVPLRRESTDESVEPGEQTLNTSSAWRRSQDNWFLGAGQEYLDNRFAFVSVYVHSGEDPSVRTRFWRSKGVNPWNEQSLSMHPEYALGQAATDSPHLVVLQGYIYAAVTVAGAQELHQLDDDFSVNSKMNQPAVFVAPVSITSVAGTGGVGGTVTFQGANAYTVGQRVTFSGLGGGFSALNGTTQTIIATGLSSSQFAITFGLSGATTTGTATAHTGGSTWPTITSMSTDGANLYIACGSYGVCILPAGATNAVPLRVNGPTVTTNVVGTTGTTTRNYWVIAIDAAGYKSVPIEATITNGNATPSVGGGNWDALSWPAVPGAVSYDVVVQTGTGAIQLLANTTSFSINNDGSVSPSGSYTLPTYSTANFQATFVLYANGWLVAGWGPILVSISLNGTCIPVMTHRIAQWNWTAGCGSPMAIYLAGNAGGGSELYGVQISSTTFSLGSPYIAGQVTNGEQINDLLYYEGLVIIATSIGVRAAQDTSQNGHLDTGPVINALGPSNCLAVWGSFVYFGVTDFAENDGVWLGNTTTSGLGRMAISQYSSALIPSYATDVMSTVEGTTSDVCVLNGVPYFGIAASGVWKPTGNVVPQAWLESGWVRYGTIENKILVTADVMHDPLEGTVQLQIVPFGKAPYNTAVSSEQGSTSPAYNVSAGNEVGEAFMVIPVLTRSATDATKGPVLHRWTCRAMVTAIRQDQIVLPIIWKEIDLSPQGEGTPLYLDLAAEWAFLKGLEQSGAAVTVQIGMLNYLAFIDQIELKGEKWNDSRTMMTGRCNVKMLTVN